MRLRGWVRRLEHAARGNLESFILEDGTRHYYDPESGEVFLHGCECIRAGYEGEPFSEPLETIRALTRARDRGAALEQVAGGTFPYDRQALIERAELVPRPMMAGREHMYREGDGLHGS
jgi:hypothetical protein